MTFAVAVRLRAAKILNQKLRLIADGFLQVVWKNWAKTLVLVHARVESARNAPEFFRAKLLVNAQLASAPGAGTTAASGNATSCG